MKQFFGTFRRHICLYKQIRCILLVPDSGWQLFSQADPVNYYNTVCNF